MKVPRRRAPLGRRLLLALAAMLLPLAAVAGAGVIAFRTSIGALEEFHDEIVSESQAIDHVRDLLVGVEEAAEEYAEEGNPAAGDQFFILSRRIERGFGELAKLNRPRERHLASAAHTRWEESFAVVEKIVLRPGLAATDPLEAFHDPLDESGELLADLYTLNGEQIASEISAFRTYEREQLLAILVILIVSSIAAALLAARLRRSITAPLLALREAATEFGSDNLSHRVPFEGDDELGGVAKAFNRMAAIVGEQQAALTATAESQQETVKSLERSEAQKEESLSLVRATLESTLDGILVVDQQGKIVDYNGKFVDMWRIPEPVMESKDDEKAISYVLDQLKDPDAFVAKVQELYGAPEGSSLDFLEFKDGRIFERYSQPQVMAGTTVGRVWSFRDMTEQRYLEGNLRQAQKMEAIGQLAGGIAHDFNNLLSVIQNYAMFLAESLEGDDPRSQDVEEIRRAGERAASLTQQLLTFSRKEVVQPVVVQPDVAAAEVAKLLGRTLREDIELSLKTSSDVRQVEIDAGQLDQLLMNLAINASDAMPHGGTMTFETRNVSLREELPAVTGTIQPGDYVRIDVADTGCGMEQQVLERIFEPFFTTKPRGTGTGLGLATVYGIIEQAGGHISVESDPGRGTTFELYLPALPVGMTSDESPERDAISGGRGETVLVAEDEEGVRGVVTRILSRNGYTVLAASSGSEALDLFTRQTDAIDIVLTDVIMPGMSGKDLTDRIGELQPGVPILYMSGYEDSTISRHGVLEGKGYLRKPFTATELLREIQRTLESSLLKR
jgi:signal transduction histidine kinase/HAMP domain-containing protein/ActR/RegA family two-component response regulator